MKTTLKSDAELLHLAASAEAAALSLHSALIRLEARCVAIRDLEHEPWTDACKDEVLHEHLGALNFVSMICQQRFAHTLGLISETMKSDAPLRATEMGEAMARGMTQAALACSCRTCRFCKIRTERGPKVAAIEIESMMREQLGLAKTIITLQ